LRTSPCPIQASPIDHICWQVNTGRTLDLKSRASHAYHGIPLRKAYHTPITHLQLISHKSQVTSHKSHLTPARRSAPSHSSCPRILGPILGKVAMPKSGMEEPCVGWRPGCQQRRGAFKESRALRGLLRPKELECCVTVAHPGKERHDA
jgi:hypothetical protein